MRVKVPKPLYGWREFAGEVGIIVIGVLIALGAAQVVQAAHQRQEAKQADDIIRAELGLNLGRLQSRDQIRGCVESASTRSKQSSTGQRTTLKSLRQAGSAGRNIGRF